AAVRSWSPFSPFGMAVGEAPGPFGPESQSDRGVWAALPDGIAAGAVASVLPDIPESAALNLIAWLAAAPPALPMVASAPALAAVPPPVCFFLSVADSPDRAVLASVPAARRSSRLSRGADARSDAALGR